MGATGSAVSQHVTAAVHKSVTDAWQAEAITSLIDPVSAMIFDERRAVIVDGHHRAFVMREQGVDETLVLLTVRPYGVKPTTEPAAGSEQPTRSQGIGA
jgi:hypothetical protein